MSQATAPPGPGTGTGRRSARATRTREAVVDALLTLIDEGNLRPTAREIAARAGVSLRSVYVHFDDVEDLFGAAAQRHFENLEPIIRQQLCDDDAPFHERVEAFVERRALIYESNANIGRAAALQEPFSPAMRRILDGARRFSRAQIDAVFSPELSSRDSPRGEWQRSGLEVVVGTEAWDVLRRRQRLSVDEAKDVMRGLVRAIIAGPETDS
jgi:AcrR family transcriptional regulator